MKCGHEPGEKNADELGVCPAAVSGVYDGLNNGKFGGRFCWAVAGTFCRGDVQGTFAKKLMNCYNCKFLKEVTEQEGWNFKLMPWDADRD